MIARILVSTPKGEASNVEKKLRAFLLTFHKPVATGTNEDASSFYWEVDVNPAQYTKLMRKLLLFQNFASWTADNKIVRKAFKQFGATSEMFDQVKKMLQDGTTIEVIKNLQAEELVEPKKSYWQRVKETFTRKL